jgi:hypothetical protein
LIPVVLPIFWIRINRTVPITAVLEARIPANLYEWEAVDAEPVIPATVDAVIIVGNAVAVIASALLPGAVLRLPIVGAVLVPGTTLLALLLIALCVGAL